MTKEYTYTCKKQFNGMVSVRDNILDLCEQREWDLVLVWKKTRMTIPYHEIKWNRFQFHSKKFKSKFNPGQEYELYDFEFVPDEPKQLKLA